MCGSNRQNNNNCVYYRTYRNKVRIVKSGAVPTLLEILQSETKMVVLELPMAFLLILSSIQAKVDGIATLQNLSTLHQIVPLVIASGAPYALLQVINFCDKSSELADKAVALLKNIISHSPESVSSIGGAIGVREMILREGVMPGLLQVSVDGTRRAKEMARELLLLLRDCSGWNHVEVGRRDDFQTQHITPWLHSRSCIYKTMYCFTERETSS
uniref:At5g14510 n=1 Tax=Arabidopsis thaliana TaxID=3702 RepID=Q6GKW0_ARATH|nr:At5g14510 [Arabidopsis thaliana]